MGTKTKTMAAGMKGLIATLAALVTVAVGVLTIGATLGWFDSGKDTKTAETTGSSSEGDGATAGRASESTESASPPQSDVDPSSVDFGSLSAEKEKVVTLTNTGEAPFSVGRPAIEGTNRGEFRVASNDCGSSLPAGGSCEVTVEFKPDASGSYSAKLSVPLGGGSSVVEVPLKATKIL